MCRIVGDRIGDCYDSNHATQRSLRIQCHAKSSDASEPGQRLGRFVGKPETLSIVGAKSRFTTVAALHPVPSHAVIFPFGVSGFEF